LLYFKQIPKKSHNHLSKKGLTLSSPKSQDMEWAGNVGEKVILELIARKPCFLANDGAFF